MDDNPAILIVVNATCPRGHNVTVMLGNGGDMPYRYSNSQASHELWIYDENGTRLSMGVPSDAYFYAEMGPGEEVHYWTWTQPQCIGSGPWYRGCDDPQPVPDETYRLRQTFGTPDDSGGASNVAAKCTAAGADLTLVADTG